LAILMDLCPSHLNISSLIQLVLPIPNRLFENKKTSIYLYSSFHLSPRKPWLKSLVSLPYRSLSDHNNNEKHTLTWLFLGGRQPQVWIKFCPSPGIPNELLK
jgi:hypothetical protein